MERTGKLLFGISLTLIYLIMVLSLFSSSSWIPPERLVLSPDDIAHNTCGRFGLMFSFFLLDLFGVGAFFLCIPLFFYLLGYWLNIQAEHIILNTIGVFFLLTGLCGYVSFLFPESAFGPVVIGAGGYFGALIHEVLSCYFATLGALLFLGSVVIAGILLVTKSPVLTMVLTFFGINSLAELVLAGFVRLFHRSIPEEPVVTQQPSEQEKEMKVATLKEQLPVKKEEAFPVLSPSLISDGIIEENSEDLKEEEKTLSFETICDNYSYPTLDLLAENKPYDVSRIQDKIEEFSGHLEKAFADYGFEVHVVGFQTGPVITLYEIELSRGTRITKIRALTPDLEIAMRVPKVRIVAPIPGKNTVGVELPNPERQDVRLRELMEECTDLVSRTAIPVFLGRDVTGSPMVIDLTRLPHLLIAGRTGTGKSVCLNAIIMSILMTRSPQDVRLILIDPKMVELNFYRAVPHLMHPVVIDMKKAEAILAWAVEKMEERYLILSRADVRNINEYNKLSPETLYKRIKPTNEEEWEAVPKHMPYLVIIADEMADLMMTSGKEVENHIIRLAQKSRAVGIHLVLATQKPTVDIITGLIKSNLPARIAFGVASRIDSQVVLDCTGAEQLLGNGDMLFLQPGTSNVIRGQGTYIDESEIANVIQLIRTDNPTFGISPEELLTDDDKNALSLLEEERDILYDQVIEVLFQGQQASVSFIQRKFRIGYTRAARIFDFLEADGIVSKANPIKKSLPREILISYNEWQLRRENGYRQEKEISVAAKETSTPLIPIQKGSDSNHGLFVGNSKTPNTTIIATPQTNEQTLPEKEEAVLEDDEREQGAESGLEEEDVEFEEEQYEEEEEEEKVEEEVEFEEIDGEEDDNADFEMENPSESSDSSTPWDEDKWNQYLNWDDSEAQDSNDESEENSSGISLRDRARMRRDKNRSEGDE